jgi:hypothetical protein
MSSASFSLTSAWRCRLSKRNLARQAVFFATSHALDDLKTYALAPAARHNNVSTPAAVGRFRASAAHHETAFGLA